MPKVNTIIQKHVFQPHDVFGKSFMMHGPTGSGKSRTSLYLASLVNHMIDIPIVYCPTNDIHGDWKGIVPDFLVRKILTSEAIRGFIKYMNDKDNAKKAAKVHVKYWHQLSEAATIDDEYNTRKQEITTFIQTNRSSLVQDDYDRLAYEKKLARRERDKKSRELIRRKYKKLYKNNGIDYSNIPEGDVVANELSLFIKYFRVKCYCLLVIDDCSDQFSNIDADTWKLLFNKCRHYDATVFMNTHNMTDIKVPCLRTAPFWQIFLAQSSASYYFNSTSTGLKGNVVIDPNSLAKSCSRDFEKNTMTKIAFQRELNAVYKFTFPLDFSYIIGDAILWRYNSILLEHRDKKPPKINPNIL